MINRTAFVGIALFALAASGCRRNHEPEPAREAQRSHRPVATTPAAPPAQVEPATADTTEPPEQEFGATIVNTQPPATSEETAKAEAVMETGMRTFEAMSNVAKQTRGCRKIAAEWVRIVGEQPTALVEMRLTMMSLPKPDLAVIEARQASRMKAVTEHFAEIQERCESNPEFRTVLAMLTR
jgi:hypothetical protein